MDMASLAGRLDVLALGDFMRDIIIGFFGDYVVPSYEHSSTVTETTSDGSITSTSLTDVVCPDGLAGVDWPYVVGCLVFCVMLWGVVKCAHIVLDRIFRR